MNHPHLAFDFGLKTASLYARAAAIQESSARLLRATGHEAAAQRAERLAAVARDSVYHTAEVAQMHSLARGLRSAPGMSDLLDQALDGAIEFLAADFGNIQLVDPRTDELRLVCQRGFSEDFLDHFAVVDDAQAACGRAATAREQAVIADVEYDDEFEPHRAIAAATGFRAVLSTPLVDRSGLLRGVLSTHFRSPHRPAAHELRMTATYARLVADAIGRRLNDTDGDHPE